ncbi:MAG: hypothetical protein ACW99L_01170 [Promethearchaeota archaeon]|jgi:hypothetical protein
MEDFLKKLQLSNHAIEIYLRSLGKPPKTFFELLSLVPKMSQGEFEEILTQLINGGLLIQLIPQKQEVLLHYLALPPILPIINYYENININLKDIKNTIQEIVRNNVNATVQQNDSIELDSILTRFQETRKDIEEDIIIQKQDVEDVVEGMEELKNLKKDISELSQQIKIGTQNQFVDLMKKISTIKSEIVEQINTVEFKKHKHEIIGIIEQIFKEHLEHIVQDFSIKLHELIDDKFNESNKPIEIVVDRTFQYRDDFKLILLNLLSNFETKMNEIYEIIKESKDTLSSEVNNLEFTIKENLTAIVSDSIDQVSGLNKPLENLMKSYYQEMIKSDKTIISDVWSIKSLTKINEEIQKIISTSKNELTIIVPNIERHIAVEQFQNKPPSLKVKVVSSVPHTNSSIKKFKSVTNLAYRSLENKNLIALKGDENQIVIGVINQTENDTKDDFIGIGSDFKPLVNLLSPLIRDSWENAYSDSFYASQKAQAAPSKPTITKSIVSDVNDKIAPVIPSTFQTVESKQTFMKEEIDKSIKTTDATKPVSDTISSRPIKPAEKISDIKQQLEETIKFTTTPTPKAEDTAGIVINDAFNDLIKKLDEIKGEDFSRELQTIADLVLEKRGFSVTLHKLRSSINQFRYDENILGELDKKQILVNIGEWKKKLV